MVYKRIVADKYEFKASFVYIRIIYWVPSNITLEKLISHSRVRECDKKAVPHKIDFQNLENYSS